jgi:uncharacterized repeat protein (TIGR01451 family)
MTACVRFDLTAAQRLALTAAGALAALFIAPAAHAQATVDNAAATAAQIGTRLQGAGVTISGAAIPAGNNSDTTTMYGLFSNGIAGAGLQINTGAALSTGTIADMFTSNNVANRSLGVTTTYNDPDLTALEAQATRNVAVVTMNVTLDAYATGFEMRYQFGSDEYPDYVGSTYNDLIAILLSGPGITGRINIAQAPSGGETDINTVNFGVLGCASSGAPTVLTNNAFYIRNGHNTTLPGACNPATQPGPFPVVMEWNGLTTALTARAENLTPGGTYALKLAVADVGDNQYDSGVIFELISATYGRDHGDAPASYGAPTHVVRSAHRMGAGVTRDSGPYNHPDAAADANDDGVVLPTLMQGQSALIPVSVTGAGGRLQAFIDWNGDGDFLDAGEQIAADVVDGGVGDNDGVANGSITLSVTVPVFVTLSKTFARFRWSTQAAIGPTAAANDGEVEDYALTVQAGNAALAATKTVAVYDPGAAGLYMTPGNDVIYTIAVSNTGNLPVDANALFLADRVPAQLEFFNSATPEFGGVVGWSGAGSGLTFTPASDLRFSNLAAPPANFAACAYTPVAGYDPNVTYVCFNPKGSFANGPPTRSFTVRLRARIK